MPAGNPFVSMIDTGGHVGVGPATAQGNLSLGVGDNHVSSGLALLALGLLILLWKSKFRFSTTVG